MTNNHQQQYDEIYQTKDGRTFDNYNDFVQAKRELNKQRLQALGLNGPLLGGSSSRQQQQLPVQETSASPQQRTMRQTLRRVSPSPAQPTPKTSQLRRSTRVQGIAAPKRVLLEEQSLFVPRKKKQRHAAVGTKPSESLLLTPEQRQQLRWSESSWLDDMQTYLIEQEHLSSQNLRSVMRQVEKLVRGVGVTYQHWPPGVSFGAGQQVTLHEDFEALHAHAVEFEHLYGRDRGNGWLLRHPITKLARYQRHLSSGKK